MRNAKIRLISIIYDEPQILFRMNNWWISFLSIFKSISSDEKDPLRPFAGLSKV